MREYTAEDLGEIENTYEDFLFELEDDHPEHHLLIKQQVVKVMLKDVDPAYRGFINMYIEELLSLIKDGEQDIGRYNKAIQRLEEAWKI